MRETIRVLLVDDNKLTCTAVRHVLLSTVDIMLLGEIATPTTLPQLYTQHEPDILLFSLKLFRDAQAQQVPLTEADVMARILLLASDCSCIYASEFRESHVSAAFYGIKFRMNWFPLFAVWLRV